MEPNENRPRITNLEEKNISRISEAEIDSLDDIVSSLSDCSSEDERDTEDKVDLQKEPSSSPFVNLSKKSQRNLEWVETLWDRWVDNLDPDERTEAVNCDLNTFLMSSQA